MVCGGWPGEPITDSHETVKSGVLAVPTIDERNASCIGCSVCRERPPPNGTQDFIRGKGWPQDIRTRNRGQVQASIDIANHCYRTETLILTDILPRCLRTLNFYLRYSVPQHSSRAITRAKGQEIDRLRISWHCRCYFPFQHPRWVTRCGDNHGIRPSCSTASTTTLSWRCIEQ